MSIYVYKKENLHNSFFSANQGGGVKALVECPTKNASFF